jgi:hypothetical protein
MDCTDYILDILIANPDVRTISLQAGAYIDTDRMPASVTWAPWAEDWSEGYAANGVLVVRFRA